MQELFEKIMPHLSRSAMTSTLERLVDYNKLQPHTQEEIYQVMVMHPAKEEVISVINRLHEFDYFENNESFKTLLITTQKHWPKYLQSGLHLLIQESLFKNAQQNDLMQLLLSADNAFLRANQLIDLHQVGLLTPYNLKRIVQHPNVGILFRSLRDLYFYKLLNPAWAQHNFEIVFSHENPADLLNMLSFFIENNIVHAGLIQGCFELLAQKETPSDDKVVLNFFFEQNLLHGQTTLEIIEGLLKQEVPSFIVSTYKMLAPVLSTEELEACYRFQIFCQKPSAFFYLLQLLYKHNLLSDNTSASKTTDYLLKHADILINHNQIGGLWWQIPTREFTSLDFKKITSILNAPKAENKAQNVLKYLENRFFQDILALPSEQELNQYLFKVVYEETFHLLRFCAEPDTAIGFYYATCLFEKLKLDRLLPIWPSLEPKVKSRFFEAYAHFFDDPDDPELESLTQMGRYLYFDCKRAFQPIMEESHGYKVFCSEMLKKSGLFAQKIDCAFFIDNVHGKTLK